MLTKIRSRVSSLVWHSLTLSSIYTHFNTLKKKALGNSVEKGEIAQNEQFHRFPQCFLWNLYLKSFKPLPDNKF